MTQFAALWFIWSLTLHFTINIQAFPAASLPCEDDHIKLLVPETIPESLVELVPEPLPIVPDVISVDREIITYEVIEPIVPELNQVVLPEIVPIISEKNDADILIVDDTNVGYSPDLDIPQVKPLDIKLPLESVLIDEEINNKIPSEEEIVAINLPVEYEDGPKLQLYPDSLLVDPVFQQSTPIKVINSIDTIELPEDPEIPENPTLIMDDNNIKPFSFDMPEETFLPCEQKSDVEDVDLTVIPPAPQLPALVVPNFPVVYTNDIPPATPDIDYIETSITNEEVSKQVMESFIIENLPYILAHKMHTDNSFDTVIVNVIKSFVLPSNLQSNLPGIPSFNPLEILLNHLSPAPSVTNYAPCSLDLPHYHEQHVSLPHYTL